MGTVDVVHGVRGIRCMESVVVCESVWHMMRGAMLGYVNMSIYVGGQGLGPRVKHREERMWVL